MESRSQLPTPLLAPLYFVCGAWVEDNLLRDFRQELDHLCFNNETTCFFIWCILKTLSPTPTGPKLKYPRNLGTNNHILSNADFSKNTSSPLELTEPSDKPPSAGFKNSTLSTRYASNFHIPETTTKNTHLPSLKKHAPPSNLLSCFPLEPTNHLSKRCQK